jgi:hypothetical protein
LEWNSVGIWDSGIKSIADALSTNKTLEDIDLRNNRIGAHGAIALAVAIKRNNSLQKIGRKLLVFENNRFTME